MCTLRKVEGPHSTSKNTCVCESVLSSWYSSLCRCREFEEGDVTPCSLVLWRIQLIQAWRDFTHSSVQLTLACGIAAIFSVFVIAVLLRTLLGKISTTRRYLNRHFPHVVHFSFHQDQKNVFHNHFPPSHFSSISFINKKIFVRFYHQHFTLQLSCPPTNHQDDMVNQQLAGKKSGRSAHISSKVTGLQWPTTAIHCRRHLI